MSLSGSVSVSVSVRIFFADARFVFFILVDEFALLSLPVLEAFEVFLVDFLADFVVDETMTVVSFEDFLAFVVFFCAPLIEIGFSTEFASDLSLSLMTDRAFKDADELIAVTLDTNFIFLGSFSPSLICSVLDPIFEPEETFTVVPFSLVLNTLSKSSVSFFLSSSITPVTANDNEYGTASGSTDFIQIRDLSLAVLHCRILAGVNGFPKYSNPIIIKIVM
mmetsp:Transcript_7878/g.8022  ORF Transcript_7878/g.8022 Transcript_7878/m.8022 type:complete len:221 (-) Transcript_7878:75-737(-)